MLLHSSAHEFDSDNVLQETCTYVYVHIRHAPAVWRTQNAVHACMRAAGPRGHRSLESYSLKVSCEGVPEGTEAVLAAPLASLVAAAFDDLAFCPTEAITCTAPAAEAELALES